jgi:hypothetical protein
MSKVYNLMCVLTELYVNKVLKFPILFSLLCFYLLRLKTDRISTAMQPQIAVHLNAIDTAIEL